jgi:hypothetical protein
VWNNSAGSISKEIRVVTYLHTSFKKKHLAHSVTPVKWPCCIRKKVGHINSDPEGADELHLTLMLQKTAYKEMAHGGTTVRAVPGLFQPRKMVQNLQTKIR